MRRRPRARRCLVLPRPEERRSDGAVKIELHVAADRTLAGKTMWLRPAAAPAIVSDVHFDARARKSIEKGNVHHTRIVALPDAKLVDGELVIGREPVIVPGDHVALLTPSFVEVTHDVAPVAERALHAAPSTCARSCRDRFEWCRA